MEFHYIKQYQSREYQNGYNLTNGGENHPLSKEYIITDVDGNTSNIKGLRKFCSDNNLDHCAMRRVAQGKQKQHKGWLCKYYETQ